MSGPLAVPAAVPSGRTARRLEWQHLPPAVRDRIAAECGAEIVEARSQGAGFTPGFASVLIDAEGRRHFVKAASVKAQRPFAESYREEARKLRELPEDVPAARLQWLVEDDWVVLGLDYIEGRAPRRPWREDELGSVLATLQHTAELLTPAPAALALDTASTEFASFLAAWPSLRETRPELSPAHLSEAAELAAESLAVTAGDTLVHTDLRDDNLLLGRDGQVWLCDWNWPVRGAAWLDTLFLLLQPRGDGLDTDRLLAELPLTREVPAVDIDRVLALLAGYFLRQAEEPAPPTSPYLRQHQAWSGAVAWNWLGERRSWW